MLSVRVEEWCKLIDALKGHEPQTHFFLFIHVHILIFMCLYKWVWCYQVFYWLCLSFSYLLLFHLSTALHAHIFYFIFWRLTFVTLRFERPGEFPDAINLSARIIQFIWFSDKRLVWSSKSDVAAYIIWSKKSAVRYRQLIVMWIKMILLSVVIAQMHTATIDGK